MFVVGGRVQRMALTIVDFEGSIHVTEPQDFEAIREEVMRQLAREIALGDQEEPDDADQAAETHRVER